MAIAENTNQLIDLWLYGKSPHSQEAYRSDIGVFVAYVECKPLTSITINDLQGFAGALADQGYSLATQARKLSAVKSLLAYGNRIGLLSVNVGAVVKVPKGKDGLAQRILTEEEVLRMFAGETNPRNYAMLRFLYATGARVGEVCALTWKDIWQDSKGQGLVTFFGKGNKTRNVIFRAEVHKIVMALRQGSRADMPVFLSRKGGHLSTAHLHKIVAAAGKRAGVEGKVSPHWLRGHFQINC